MGQIHYSFLHQLDIPYNQGTDIGGSYVGPGTWNSKYNQFKGEVLMLKRKRIMPLFLAIAMVFSFTGYMQPVKEAKAASTLVWSDEFDGNSLNRSNWTYDIGNNGWGNNEWQYYTDRNENVSVSNGVLAITARKENYGGSGYTSARIKSIGLREFKYGRIEARIKLPKGQGLWPAFWMLGANFNTAGWPYCGEIDIMEQVSLENRVHGTVHWDSNGYASYGGPSFEFDTTQYHVYAIDWNDQYIRWYVDGTQFHEIYIGNNAGGTEEFQKPFFLILNLAVGGNWPGYPNDSTPFPSTMYVDYVRVYQDVPGQQQGYSFIKSAANNKFICADNYGNAPLVANRDAGSDWESFQVIYNNDGTISLKSKANGLYVCADLNQDTKLVARSGEIQAWEKFYKQDYGNGQFALKAVANNNYVKADLNDGGILKANSPSIGGSWESFSFVQ